MRAWLLLALAAGCAGNDGDSAGDSAEILDSGDSADSADTGDTADTADSGDTVDTGDGSTFDPDPTCAYEMWVEYVLRCGGGYVAVWEMMSLTQPVEQCPIYYDRDGVAFATVEDAAAIDDCPLDCVYRAHQAVMILYCETRGEYISYVGGGPGQTGTEECPEIQHYMTVAGSGWYESFEQFQAENACPQG